MLDVSSKTAIASTLIPCILAGLMTGRILLVNSWESATRWMELEMMTIGSPSTIKFLYSFGGIYGVWTEMICKIHSFSSAVRFTELFIRFSNLEGLSEVASYSCFFIYDGRGCWIPRHLDEQGYTLHGRLPYLAFGTPVCRHTDTGSFPWGAWSTVSNFPPINPSQRKGVAL